MVVRGREPASERERRLFEAGGMKDGPESDQEGS